MAHELTSRDHLVVNLKTHYALLTLPKITGDSNGADPSVKS